MPRNNKRGQRRNKRQPETPNHALRTLDMGPLATNTIGVAQTRRMRFASTAAVSSGAALVSIGVSYQNLLDTILVATTATQLYQLFQAVRIRAVSVWAPLPIQGTNNARGVATAVVAFQPNPTSSVDDGDNAVHEDTSAGMRPAYVCARPAPRSGAALWNASGTETAFSVTCSPGAIIEVHADYRNQLGLIASVGAAQSGSGAIAGRLYLRGLDGLAAATTAWPPTYAIANATYM